MIRKLLFIPLVLAAIFTALSLTPSTKADDWDKKTIVTFDQDVEIPGLVLPAGTYVFKLFRSDSNRFIVQVWDQDEYQLYSTQMTVGDSNPNPTGKAYFVLDMTGTDEGYPPAVVSWFFGGGDEGRDFIYSGSSNTRMVPDSAQPVPDDTQPQSDSAQPQQPDNAQPQPDQPQPQPAPQPEPQPQQ